MTLKRDKKRGMTAAGIFRQTRPNCANINCNNPTDQKRSGKDGWITWRPFCSTCYRTGRGVRENYPPDVIPIKKNYCENIDGRLGSVCQAKDLELFQLDLDHIDGNKENVAPENFQTLCKNCHALKTIQQGDNAPSRHPMRERYKTQVESQKKIFVSLFGEPL